MKRRKKKKVGCPCGGERYDSCCAPFHRGEEPPDAPTLMRSRFSAFARGDASYLWRTLHPQHDDRSGDVEAFRERIAASKVRYESLRVLDDAKPDEDGAAQVLFLARLRHAGRDASFVERSTFVHDGTGWRYLAGESWALSAFDDPTTLTLADVSTRAGRS